MWRVLQGWVRFPTGGDSPRPGREIGWLIWWNSRTDGHSPDGRQHAHRRARIGAPPGVVASWLWGVRPTGREPSMLVDSGTLVPGSGSVRVGLDSVEAALAEIEAGRPVIVVDDEGRENEGDLIMAADAVTPEWMAF